MVLFCIGTIQQFFKKYLFFKFISKCQKEILRCVPPSSLVCDFLVNITHFVFIYSGWQKKRLIWKKGTLLPWEIIVASEPVGYEYIWVWYLIKHKQVYWLCLKPFLLPHFFVILTSITYHVSRIISHGPQTYDKPAKMSILVEAIISQWTFNHLDKKGSDNIIFFLK